jgi:hypothetical protein
MAPSVGTARFAARREHQLEQRHGIAETFLQSTERAISVVCGDEHAFADQRRCGYAKQTVAATAQRAPPHVGDGKQHLYGDNGMEGSKGQRGSREFPHSPNRVVPSHLS